MLAASTRRGPVRYARKNQIVNVVSKKGHNRRAQNLGERYVRLEKSLRGKGESRVAGTGTGVKTAERIVTKEKRLVVFRGVGIPREPRAPASDGEFVFGFVRPLWLRFGN